MKHQMKHHIGRDPNEVGAFAAKTNLAQLLDRVENGEVIVITRHGHPVARLVPMTEDTDRERIERAIVGLLESQKGCRLNGVSIEDLINAGRA